MLNLSYIINKKAYTEMYILHVSVYIFLHVSVLYKSREIKKWVKIGKKEKSDKDIKMKM